jgi:hypothetical protein
LDVSEFTDIAINHYNGVEVGYVVAHELKCRDKKITEKKIMRG